MAQIELMSIDQPIVVYHKDKDNGKNGKEPKKANPLDVIAAEDRWLAQYGGKERKPIQLDINPTKPKSNSNDKQ